ncbi:hypothetical protein [Nocardia sp. NBC_01388]|uniref:hypothetical protein n=1 Tax=Nocardia sp. NBC_01388 TaxID=2903596 RepID=UPI003248548F
MTAVGTHVRRDRPSFTAEAPNSCRSTKFDGPTPFVPVVSPYALVVSKARIQSGFSMKPLGMYSDSTSILFADNLLVLLQILHASAHHNVFDLVHAGELKPTAEHCSSFPLAAI